MQDVAQEKRVETLNRELWELRERVARIEGALSMVRSGSPEPMDLKAQIDLLFRAVYGWSIHGDSAPENAAILACPDIGQALRTILNSGRGRWHMRVSVPIWHEDKWICTEFHGLRMWVNLRDIWLGWGPLANSWEEPETDFILSRLPVEGAFLDVGTNVGPFTLRAARRVGSKGHVYGFEPRPDTYGMLARSVADNAMSEWVTLYNKAVGDQDISGFLHMDRNANAGHSYVKSSDDDGTAVKIDIVRIDSIKFDRRIDVMKMDVEGFDGRALKGAVKTIREHKPLFVGEFFPDMLRKQGGGEPAEYIKDWRDLGYAVHLLDDGSIGEAFTPERASDETSYPQLVSIVALPPT